MIRSFVAGAVALIALLGLSACSSGSSNGKASPTSTTAGATNSVKDWNPAALTAAKALAAKVKAAHPSECKNFEILPYVSYSSTANTIKSPIPAAVGDCDAFGDTIEISTFTNADARSQFVTERTDILCRTAAKAKYNLDGIRWNTGDDWSVQVDTQSAGDTVKQVLGGSYEAKPCPNHTLDWEDAGVAKIRELAATLAKNKTLGCTNFELLDRSQYARLQAYQSRLPAAYGRCQGPGNSVLWIAAFSDKTVTPDKFIAAETKSFCDSSAIGKGVEGVKGDNWAVIATNTKAAELAARATGGTALDPAC